MGIYLNYIILKIYIYKVFGQVKIKINNINIEIETKEGVRYIPILLLNLISIIDEKQIIPLLRKSSKYINEIEIKEIEICSEKIKSFGFYLPSGKRELIFSITIYLSPQDLEQIKLENSNNPYFQLQFKEIEREKDEILVLIKGLRVGVEGKQFLEQIKKYIVAVKTTIGEFKNPQKPQEIDIKEFIKILRGDRECRQEVI